MASTKGSESPKYFIAKISGYIAAILWFITIFPHIEQKQKMHTWLLALAGGFLIIYLPILIIISTLYGIGLLCFFLIEKCKKLFP